MATKPTHKLLGLVQDTNPHETPAGALDVAKNVVFRRPDVAEPRPGFYRDMDGPGSQNGHDSSIMQLFTWGTTRYGAMANADFCRISGTPATLTGADATGYYSTSAVPMRGNLYVNTTTGLQKLTSVTDDAFEKAHGLGIPVVLPIWGLAGTTYLTGEAYAWRALIARKDANGVWTYGVPSGRTVAENDSAGTVYTTEYIVLPTYGCVAGDYLIVYRSRASSADPDDELGEVWRHEITSAEITTGYVVLSDTSADNERGAALYTNPSRGGIAAANFEPPYSLAMAEYRGCLFAANITTPWRITLTFDEGMDCSGSSTGIGYRTINGTRTNGSTTITLASTTGLQVGMLLAQGSFANWSGTGPVRITTVNAGVSVVVNSTWNGATDGAPVALSFVDSIRVGSNYYPAGITTATQSQVLGTLLCMNTSLYATTSMRVSADASFRCFGGSSSQKTNYTTYAAINRAQLFIEEIVPKSTDTAPQVWATHGDEYFPALPLPTAGTGREMTREALPNGLAWSKQDEPQHFMLASFERVGDASANIRAIKQAGESLYVFQDNGDVWRVYGFGPATGWRTDRVARGITILGPRACDVMGEAVFVNAIEGVFAIDANGARNISSGFIGDALRDTSASTTDPRWLVCNPSEDEIVIGLGELETNNHTAYVYCCSVGGPTPRWSSWSLQKDDAACVTDMCAVGSALAAGVEGLYTYAAYNGTYNNVWRERTPTNDAIYRYSDWGYAIDISNPSGTSYDWANSAGATNAGYSPAVGDVLDRNGVYWIITSITDANTFVAVNEAGTTMTAGWTVTVLRAYECDLKWRAIAGGSAGTKKRFSSFELSAERMERVRTATLTYDSDWNSEGTQDKTGTYTATGPRAYRAIVKRPHAIARWLKPGIRIKQAGAYFKIDGMQISYEHITRRVSR